MTHVSLDCLLPDDETSVHSGFMGNHGMAQGALTDIARAGGERLLISSMNLGEVYCNSSNVWGALRADKVLADIDALPVHVFHPRQEDVMAAARLKARFRCSFADALSVVLATEFDGVVVTGDPDFLKMRDCGVFGVGWWGA